MRILHLGDSHTASPLFANRVRERLEVRFGPGGPGLVAPGPRQGAVPAQLDFRAGNDWSLTTPANGAAPRHPALGGFVGQGSAPYQTLQLRWRGHDFQGELLVYARSPAGPATPGLALFRERRPVEPARFEVTPLDATTALHRYAFATDAATVPHSLLVRKAGAELQLAGLTWLRRGPGVTYSTIGTVGASFAALEQWDSAVSRRQVADFAPQLLILAFGTNDTWGRGFDHQAFRQRLQRVAGWITRHAPDAAVLVILPPNKCLLRPACVDPSSASAGARQCDDSLNLHLQLSKSLLREIAAGRGWATWDWAGYLAHACDRAAAREGRPLVSADGIHLSAFGYEVSADGLAAALLP